MNREIEYISSITTTAILDATGSWTMTGAPQQPNECVVRQITYAGVSVAPFNMYVIQSEIHNGIIGTVCASDSFTSSPQTRIRLYNPLPGTIRFQLLRLTSNGLIPVATATDMISINLDFIKYRA